MTKISKGVFIVSAIFLSAVQMSFPMSVEAKAKAAKRPCYKGFCPALVTITKGADEKDFDNPTTRCLTKEIKAMYDAAKTQLEKDVAKYGKGKDEQNKVYTERIEMGWSAMHEPYCGYGSNGLGAVKHSLDKTFGRAHADYLEAVGAKSLAKK